LGIIKENVLNETTKMKSIDKMLIVLASIVQNKQVFMLKSMVLDLGWFNGDRTKFEHWWRKI